jgi:hypothetical protein
MLSTRIEEAILASCKSGTVGCSGRKEEERGVERELDVGVDANRRLFAGGTPPLEVRMGEDAKDWEREGSEGVGEDFVNFGGGFEVEALAFIAQRDGLNKSRLADHADDASWPFNGFRVLMSLTHPTQYALSFIPSFFSPPPLCGMTEVMLAAAGDRVHLPNLDTHCTHPPTV